MCYHHFQKYVPSRKVQTFLPPNQLDIIDNNGHLSCGFIHLSFLVQLLGNCHPVQRVFAIQVRIIGLSSVGIAKGMLFVNKTMKEYKIQLPTSMVKVYKSITTLLHAPFVLDICQCFPSSNQENRTADTLTKVSPPIFFVSIANPFVASSPRCPSEGV